jgi:4-hydroxythreonine-4-phosphate dehydrogenase
MKPRIAMVIGDPAGIGSELVARLLGGTDARSKADILLVADRDEIEEGMRIAGTRFDYRLVNDPAKAEFAAGVPLLFDFSGRGARPYARAESTANGGRYSLDTLERSIDLTVAGVTEAVCFAPLNKHSMHQGGLAHNDETHWFAEKLRPEGAFGELNVLDRLWTSRVTSHVALRDVADLITAEGVADAIDLISRTLRQAGYASPRIAVCGLNPHNGDNGSFGREEIDVIAPGVALAASRGVPANGPFPADTIFLKAQAGEVDAIVTMYHDQGQIAMKLMGFSRGVTVHGGLPIPITTPAHGTAFDIHGKGKANVGAMQQAFDLACAMAVSRRQVTR